MPFKIVIERLTGVSFGLHHLRGSRRPVECYTPVLASEKEHRAVITEHFTAVQKTVSRSVVKMPM